eukprot:s3382_g1.t1
MVQRQALPVIPGKRKPRPWEVNNYIVATYHKAGAFLSDGLTRTILEILGAPKEVFGHVEYPCYSSGRDSWLCHNMEAPFRVYIDAFNASVESVERLKSGSKKLLVAGFVRDPLEMVASAYCYHHAGQELGNQLFPVQEIMQMGPEEGTEVTATALLPLAEWMTSVFEHPDEDTLRLDFEDLTKSSAGFDSGVQRLLNHFFGTGTDLISTQERFLITERAKKIDANRNPEATTVYINSSFPSVQHSSDPVCKKAAHSALHKSLNPALLASYQDLQRRLGYAGLPGGVFSSSSQHPSIVFPLSSMARTAQNGLASGAHAMQTFPNVYSVAASPTWAPPKAPEDISAMDELRLAVQKEDWAMNFEEGLTKIQMRSEWSASEDRCGLLQWLVKSTHAKRVLEIGSFCGVGSLAIAEALGGEGELISLELDPFVVNFGRRFGGPRLRTVQTMMGPAIDSLTRLCAAKGTRPFELVIIDADKAQAPHQDPPKTTVG